MFKRASTEGAPVKLLVTMEEAAQALGVCRSVMYALVMRKQIVSIKIGRARRVPVKALEAFIARQLGEAGIN
jgi:excisionase family DNA binding protein